MSLSLDEAKAEFGSGRYKNTLLTIESLEASGFVHPELWVLKGLAILSRDEDHEDHPTYKLEDAERAFKHALSLDPGYVPALVELGWYYLAVCNKAAQAIGYFEQAIEAEKRDLKRLVEGLVISVSEVRGNGKARLYLEELPGNLLSDIAMDEIAPWIKPCFRATDLAPFGLFIWPHLSC